MRGPAGWPDGSPSVPLSPYEPEAGAQGVVVGAAPHLADAGEEERGTLVEGGNGGQAEEGAVARGGGTEDGELCGLGAGEGGSHGARGVGELKHPAETQAEIERRAAADLEAGGEVGTEGGRTEVVTCAATARL